jgi:hypothetical protein
LYERRKDILELGTRRLGGHGGGRRRPLSTTTAQSILVFRRGARGHRNFLRGWPGQRPVVSEFLSPEWLAKPTGPGTCSL